MATPDLGFKPPAFTIRHSLHLCRFDRSS